MTKHEGEANYHIVESLEYVKSRKIPYVIYTAHSEGELDFIRNEWKKGKVLEKAGAHKSSEEDVFNFLKKEIANSPKVKYPEPFACFGGDYLDVKYQELLINVISILENSIIINSENLLYNSCRTILEQVFKKLNEVDEKVLPYSILNFDDQRVGLVNCSKYLNGIRVKIRYWEDGKQKTQELQNQNFFSEYISQQVQSIIGICHPASHEVQKAYTSYTFKSVFWALFDVLIWLKKFIDERE